MVHDSDEALALSLDAMQLDSPSDLITLDLNDLPDDLLRLIALKLSHVVYGEGKGGMNVLRLVSKRLMQVVESCATRLTKLGDKGPESFPLALRRCKRIEHITCWSSFLKSLEGCPDGLKSLIIRYGDLLSSLEPLRGCTELESLEIGCSFRITDLSPLASMPLLEDLKILGCSNIKSLNPLSGLKKLRSCDVRGVDPQTSVLPLSLCESLKVLISSPMELSPAVDLEELMKKMPELIVVQ